MMSTLVQTHPLQTQLPHHALVKNAVELKHLLSESLGREGAIYLLDYVTRKHGHHLSESAAKQFIDEMHPSGEIDQGRFGIAFAQLTSLPDLERSKIGTLLKYTLTAELCTAVGLHVMNYGFKDNDLLAMSLLPHEHPIRYGLKLYEHVAQGAQMRGRDVVEIGSGLGAGAAFLARVESPRSYTGVDLVPAHTEASTSYASHGFVPNLQFALGDAEAIPLPDRSRDVALNVESLHCYPRPERFFTEIGRVLRQQGTLHVADFFSQSHLDLILELAEKTGFKLKHLQDINPEIQAAVGPHLQEIRELGKKADPEIAAAFDRIIVTRTFDQPNSNWRNANVRYWSMRLERNSAF